MVSASTELQSRTYGPGFRGYCDLQTRDEVASWDIAGASTVAVDPTTLPAGAEATHVNLNDRTLEGLRHQGLRAFSVQYHPEAAAGPHDSSYLFEEFRTLMG